MIVGVVAAVLAEGGRTIVGACVVGLGVVFVVVGTWAERKVSRGDFRHPSEQGT